MPYSPRWLVQVGRSQDAQQVLKQVQKCEDVEDELRQMVNNLAASSREFTSSFGEIFGRKYVRRTVLGVLMMSFQQLTGVSFAFSLLKRDFQTNNLSLRLMPCYIMPLFSSNKQASPLNGQPSSLQASQVW